MLLSTKITYSVRSLAYIANYVSGQRPIPLSEIAEVEGISLHYLEQLFNKLRRGGIVNSVRGPKGGFLLARPATAISIDDIIQVLGIEVFSNLAEGDGTEAPSDRSCIHGTGRMWVEFRDYIRTYLGHRTLQEIIDDCHQKAGDAAVSSGSHVA
ncbi:MAG: Rrf2 family transcriptional regulator [Nitrospirae bacterium CG_4_8_14_3_um_filter_70_85]|nr:Rrf2 family transcriptional regulator [Deltaproteobacteria bacterium]PIW81987.1 MAG: Rrf2 family transcriptional regulator [Nitrospirae bacterium CG_4_8_14_3_um_filter_70_85]HBB41792.1 Rrf2 family transcriptional regulator [Pseudomonadota bacterium]